VPRRREPDPLLQPLRAAPVSSSSSSSFWDVVPDPCCPFHLLTMVYYPGASQLWPGNVVRQIAGFCFFA
jgi:hypothetical protein